MNQMRLRCQVNIANWSRVTANDVLLTARAMMPKKRPTYSSLRPMIRSSSGIAVMCRPIPQYVEAIERPENMAKHSYTDTALLANRGWPSIDGVDHVPRMPRACNRRCRFACDSGVCRRTAGA